MIRTLPLPRDARGPQPSGGVRIVALGPGIDTWRAAMQRRYPHLQITTVDWHASTWHAGSALGAVPQQDTFDVARVQFVNLLLSRMQWPVLVGELVDHLAPDGWIEVVDAGIISTFPPDSALAAIEAMTALFADARSVACFLPECLRSLLETVPGVVQHTIHTTSDLVPVGNSLDGRGADYAAWWVEQRIPLLSTFAAYGLLPGGERQAHSLARIARAESRWLSPPVCWRITTTRAQVAPLWSYTAQLGRRW
jgi:hypothetical protein